MHLRLIRPGPWRLYAVATESEDCQLASFLESNPSDSLAGNKEAFLKRLETISQQGPPRNTEISHQIVDDIWQLEKGRVRALYFYGQPRRTLVFSHGFVKTSQKTKKVDIKRAEAALKAFNDAYSRGTITYLED